MSPAAPQPVMSMAVPQAVEPTAAEEALVAQLKAKNEQQESAYTHLQSIKTPEELEAEAAAQQVAPPETPPRMTSEKQAAIMNLSRDDNKSIATLEKEANEVVISLH